MKNKDNVLITLANKKYIAQAKQLFSSAYWNAGWKGDYLLLAHDIPEYDLKWFRDKGIKIYKCKPLWKEKKYGTLNTTVLSKFYLFKPYFKKWKTIIYIDADAIIKASLQKLTEKKQAPGFSRLSAVTDDDYNLGKNITRGRNYSQVDKRYGIKSQSFNSGFLVIDTKSVKKNDFKRLQLLIDKYSDISILGEQGILNIYFHNKWNRLLRPYNIIANAFKERYRLDILKEEDKAIILHFANIPKPWDKRSAFYDEWKKNLKLAEKINLDKIRPSFNTFNEKELIRYDIYLRKRVKATQIKRYLYANTIAHVKKHHNTIKKEMTRERVMYYLGRIIKKVSPKLYYKLGGKN